MMKHTQKKKLWQGMKLHQQVPIYSLYVLVYRHIYKHLNTSPYLDTGALK